MFILFFGETPWNTLLQSQEVGSESLELGALMVQSVPTIKMHLATFFHLKARGTIHIVLLPQQDASRLG